MRNLKTSFFCINLIFILLFLALFSNAFFAIAAESTNSITPNDPYYNEQWYLDKIGAPQAWGIKNTSPNVIVAVLDTGVDINHPDLEANIWINNGEIADNGIDDDNNGYIDDINGWDFYDDIADPKPKFTQGFSEIGLNHGTIVAGIIAAEGNNNFGITGVTWSAKIMPLKVLSDSGEGDTGDVIQAIDYAIDNGADIINLSFVGGIFEKSLEEAIRRAYDAGVIVVAAAGNEDAGGVSHDLDIKPSYPVCHDVFFNTVIGVAATDPLDQKAEFSNFGKNCIDISAPGTSFIGLSVYDPTKVYDGKIYDLYQQGFWSGTSMSTPVISGSLALLKSIDPKLSAKEVVDAMLSTADNIENLNPEYKGTLGRGRVNLAAAAQKIYNKLTSQIGYVITAPQTNASTTINFYGDKQTEFKAFSDNFFGGANISAGDIDGDGTDEIIAGAGNGGGAHIRVFNNDGSLKSQFFAFDKSFRNGVFVAAGDIDGDGTDEIIAGSGKDSLPKIKVFDGYGNLKSEFFAYAENFRGGVNVASGDIDGDGTDEIIAGAGNGGGPQVRIFDAKGVVKQQFFAYAENFRGGVNVASGDINQDGIDEIVTGAGQGGGPHVRVFDKDHILLKGFFAYDNSMSGGVNVAVINVKVK